MARLLSIVSNATFLLVHRSHAFRSCDHTGFSTFLRNVLRPRPVVVVVVVVICSLLMVLLSFPAREEGMKEAKDHIAVVVEGYTSTGQRARGLVGRVLSGLTLLLRFISINGALIYASWQNFKCSLYSGQKDAAHGHRLAQISLIT